LSKRIFDIVFFYNELDILNRRINLLRPHVSHFIILNFGDIDLFPEEADVTIYKMRFKRGPFFSNNFFEYLFFLFDFDEFKYDDFFFFSKTTEIPDVQNLLPFLNVKSFEPLILSHTNFSWSPNLVAKQNFYGTRVVQYSNILRNEQLKSQLYRPNPLQWDVEIVNNGYRLFGFGNFEEIVSSEQFWYDYLENENINFLKLQEDHNSLDWDGQIIHHFFEESTNFPEHLLPLVNYEIQKGEMKLFVDLTIEGSNIMYFWDGAEQNHYFEYPQTILYSNKSFEEFLIDFKKNEILTLIKMLPYTRIESVEIKKTTETVVFETFELLNSIPSELF